MPELLTKKDVSEFLTRYYSKPKYEVRLECLVNKQGAKETTRRVIHVYRNRRVSTGTNVAETFQLYDIGIELFLDIVSMLSLNDLGHKMSTKEFTDKLFTRQEIITELLLTL